MLPRPALLLLAAGSLLASCTLPAPAPPPDRMPREEAPWGSPDPGIPPSDPAPPDSVPPLPPPHDAVDQALQEFDEYVHGRPGPAAVARRVLRLGLLKDPRVAAAFLPLLDRGSLEVRVAVARVIGDQKDPSVGDLLLRMADQKRTREEPEFLAALLDGIGDAVPGSHAEDHVDLGKKWLDRDARVAAAAFRSAARWVTAEVVADLVKQLERAAVPTPDAGKAAARAATRTALVDLLQRITGRGLEEPGQWEEWWRDHRKGWRADGGAQARLAPLWREILRDPERGYELARPGPDWVLQEFGTGQPRATAARVAAPGEEVWVAVSVMDRKTFELKSPEAWAAEAAAAEERAYPVRAVEGVRSSFRVVEEGRKVHVLTTAWRGDLDGEQRREAEEILEGFRAFR
ncbi:MAG: HEAT repeat domain-containing protein [Planctomycetes bacterium]|nr:HEAT repeat domain-containing protein [Planctomycetota bacterium]